MPVRRYFSGVYKVVENALTAFSPAPTFKIEFVSDPGTLYDATAVAMNGGKAYHAYYDHDSDDPEIAYFYCTVTDEDASDVAMLDSHWQDLDEVQTAIAALPSVAEIWAGITTAAKTAIANAVWAFTGGRTITNTNKVTYTGPISADGGTVTLNYGADYKSVLDNALEWTLEGWPDLSEAELTYETEDWAGDDAKTVTFVSSTGDEQLIRCELDQDETAGIKQDSQTFEVWAQIGENKRLVKKGIQKCS